MSNQGLRPNQAQLEKELHEVTALYSIGVALGACLNPK